MNSSYKDLKDTCMSYRLWNNTHYNVIFKNIEDIKNKKEECLKKSKKYGYIFNILFTLFVGFTISLAILSIYSLSSGNKIGEDFILIFFIGISLMFFFATLVKVISDNLSNKYNDILVNIKYNIYLITFLTSPIIIADLFTFIIFKLYK